MDHPRTPHPKKYVMVSPPNSSENGPDPARRFLRGRSACRVGDGPFWPSSPSRCDRGLWSWLMVDDLEPLSPECATARKTPLGPGPTPATPRLDPNRPSGRPRRSRGRRRRARLLESSGWPGRDWAPSAGYTATFRKRSGSRGARPEQTMEMKCRDQAVCRLHGIPHAEGARRWSMARAGTRAR